MEKLKKYFMNWREQDSAWEVVFAHNFEEAEEKFEKGEYELEFEEKPEVKQN